MNVNYPPSRFHIGQRVIFNDYSEGEDTGEITPCSLAGTVYGLVYNPPWGMPGWYYFVRFDNDTNIGESLHESYFTPEF